MNDTIRGITIWRPWAWAIAHAGKTIENRSWSPPNGVTHLAIHAGSKWCERAASAIRNLGHALPQKSDVPGGQIVAVVRISHVIESSDSEWWHGPRGWVLTDLRVLARPIERSGLLGCWKLSSHEIAEIESQTGIAA